MRVPDIKCYRSSEVGETCAGVVSSHKALWSLCTLEGSKEEGDEQIRRGKWHKQSHRNENSLVFKEQ